MAFSVQCPRCTKGYSLADDTATGQIRCKACGHTFWVASPMDSDEDQAPAAPAPAASQRVGLEDLFDQTPLAPAGPVDLSAASTLDSTAALGGQWTTYRPRRRGGGDMVLLILGAVLAGVGLGCLLVLFPLLEVSGAWALFLGVMPALIGGGLLAYALRRNALAALPAATAVVCLVVIGLVIQPRSKPPEQASEDLVAQMGEMAQLMESIRDEAGLNAARSKIVKLFSAMLKTGRSLDGQGAEQLSPDKRQAIYQAMRDFDERMASVAMWLPEIPGGAELGRELAKLAESNVAAAPKPVPAAKAVLSEQKRGQLKALGLAFHRFHDAHSKAPSDWESLEGFLDRSPNERAAVQQLHAQGVVVQWGVSFAKATIGTSNFVLAYEKDAPQKGGGVLMMDGSVWSLTAEDLRDKLHAQVPVVQAATGVAPPAWPATQTAEEAPPSLIAWIPSGWTAPPPPESEANREARHKAMEQAGNHPNLVLVCVEGITSRRMADAVSTKIAHAIGGKGIVMRSVHAAEPEEFRCGGVEDIRELASKLDLGPITKLEEPKGIIHVRLIPAKLAQRVLRPRPSAPLAARPAQAPPTAVASSSLPSKAPTQESQATPLAPGHAPFSAAAPSASPSAPPENPFEPVPSKGPPSSASAQSSSPSGAAENPFEPAPAESRSPSAGGQRPTSSEAREPSGPAMFPPMFGPPMGPRGMPMAGPMGFSAPGRKTELIGGSGGSTFFTARGAQPVLGFVYRPASWAGKQALGLLEPFYQRNAPSALQSVVAKEGYAVGGLIVDAQEYVSAVKVVFVRLQADGRPNPADTYTSDWIGHPTGGPTRTLDAKGAKVIGVHGRRAAVLDAIGLLLE